MEQLDHEVAPVAQRHQRGREGEGLGEHRRELALEAVAGEEGREHGECGIGEGGAPQRPARRKPRRHEEPAIRRRSPQQGIGERQVRRPTAGADDVHATSLAGGAATGEIHTSQSMPAARKACSIARAIRSPRSRVHQAKTLGPPPEMLAPSAPSSSAAAFTGANPLTSGARSGSTSTSRSPRTDAVQVVPEAPGEHQGEIGALLDEQRELEGPLQHRPRGAGLEDLVRMHQHAGEPVGDRDGDEALVRREREASEEHRSDVVAVLGAARRGLAGERAPVEHVHRHRPIEQRARRHQGRDAGGRRAAHPRAERDALLDPHGEAMGELQPVPERHERPSSGVPLRLQRQSAHHALDSEDAHLRRLVALDGDPVHRTHEGVTEHVEAHTDIAHRGRCGGGRAGTIHALRA